jgi:hypothetical protein
MAGGGARRAAPTFQEFPMRSPTVLALLAPLAVLPAQNHLYSPPEAATADANSENSRPFSGAGSRYLQMHGDLIGPARTVMGLAMRRDGNVGALASAAARTMDLELYCFHATAGRPSTTFTANYATAPVPVLARRLVTLPDWTANLGSPAPWNLLLPFDAPFAYGGTQPFGWEVRIHGTTVAGNYFADGYESTGTYGRSTTRGTGCTATGRSTPMTLTPQTFSNRATNAIQFGWWIGSAPANAPSTFLIGGLASDLPVPGLCTNLYVGGGFVTVDATANAAGTATMPAVAVAFAPAFVGAQLHGQGASVDAGQSGLPIALSQGASVTVAAIPVLHPIYRLYGGLTETTGVTDTRENYGLAVRLTVQ